jgi:hypothetical protein
VLPTIHAVTRPGIVSVMGMLRQSTTIPGRELELLTSERGLIQQDQLVPSWAKGQSEQKRSGLRSCSIVRPQTG